MAYQSPAPLSPYTCGPTRSEYTAGTSPGRTGDRRSYRSSAEPRAPFRGSVLATRRAVLSAALRGCLILLAAADGRTNALAQMATPVDPPVVEARVRFNPSEGPIGIPVLLDGKCHLFMLDSGATHTAVDESFRTGLGDPLRSLTVHAPDGSAQERQLFYAPRGSVAGLPLTGVYEVLCFDHSRFRAAIGVNLYGMLGMDFLRNRIVRIDFDQGEVAFLEAVGEDPGTPVVMNVPRSRKWPPAVVLNVRGMGDLKFIVDTGYCATGAMNTHIIRRLLSDGLAQRVGTGTAELVNGSHDYGTVRLRGEVVLGGFRHRDLVFDESAVNILGIGYLSRYIVTFDFPDGRMYLKPGKGFADRCPCDLGGADLWRPNGLTTVRSVEVGGAAEAAGLRAGDIVEEIDSRPVNTLTVRQAWRLLCATPGKHVVRLLRGDETVRTVLLLKEPPEMPATKNLAGPEAGSSAPALRDE